MTALLQLSLLGFLCALSLPTNAQTNSCTQVAVSATQDVTAFSVCKRVTNNAANIVCAVTGVDSTQWASFYNNPPTGVTIAACSAPVNGVCHTPKDGTCDAGTVNVTGTGYDDCPGVYGPTETYECVGSGGGTTANCGTWYPFGAEACCGGAPC